MHQNKTIFKLTAIIITMGLIVVPPTGYSDIPLNPQEQKPGAVLPPTVSVSTPQKTVPQTTITNTINNSTSTNFLAGSPLSSTESLSPQVNLDEDLEFDGTNFKAIANTPDINLGIHPERTIAIWFRVEDPAIKNRKQVIYEEGGAGRGLNIYVHDGKLYVGGWNAMGESNWQGTYLSTNLQGNGWHHVALTLKGGPTIGADVLKGYLDGAEFGRGAGSQLWEHAALIGIGGMNNATRFHDETIMDGNGHYLKGKINGVEIYNRELSAREIGILAKPKVSSLGRVLKLENDLGFDGTNFKAIANTPDINLGIHTERTISIWFQVNDVSINTRKQVIYEEGGAGRGLNIYVHDGKLYVGGWNAMGESNWQGTYLSTNLQGNGWHHVALTLKGGPTISADVLKGYLDGAEFGRGAGSQLWEHAALIGIGGMNNATRFHDEAIMDGNGHYLKGRINGVEIYNRELSAREIGVLAKTAVPSIAPSSLNLTNIQAVPSSDSALIRWTTDVLSNGQVEYSIHSDMSQPQYLFSNDSIVRFHSVMATGLKANTVYYYRVKSSDLKGNVKISEVKSFTTLPLPDTTAPIVSNISVTAAPSTATITWTTDEASDTQVEYATNGGMSGFQSSPLNSAMVTQHSVTLSQLNPDTQYYYRVRSKDQAGNVIVSAVNFFTTRPLPDTTPPALSNIKVTALVGGVNISWTTNELSDTQVEYSTDKSMRNSLFSPLNSSLTAQHSVTVSGLNIGTPYYYRIRSKDQSGNLTISEVSTFSPLPAPDTKPPSISNIQLVSAADGAKITWTTDEASDTQVEYAINPEMEDSQLSPINEKLVTQHSATLSGLNRLTAYYYRVRSKDAAGNLTLSSISVFKTVPPPPSAPLPPRQSINDANISIQAGFNIKSIVLYDFLQSNNSARNTFNEFYQGYVFIPQAGARNDNNPGQYILLRDFLNQITNKLGYNQAAHLDNLQKALSLRAKLGNITLIKDFETFYGTRPSGRLHLISKDLALKAVSQPGYNEAYLLKNLPVITQIYTQARDMQNGLNYPTGFRFFDMIFGTNLPRGTEFTGAFLSDQDRQILFNAYETFKSELPSAINSQTSIQAITGWLNIIHGMATIYNTIKTDPSRGPAFFGINGSITTTGPLTDKDRALLYTAAKNVAAKTSLAIIIKGDPNLVKYFGALFDERWKPGKIYVFDDSSQRVLFEYIANTPSFNLGEFLTALKKAGEFHTAYFPTAKINDVFQEIFSWNGAPNKNAISGGTILLKLVSMPGYVPANLRSQISMAYSINLLLKKDGAAMAALNNLYKLGTNNLAKGYLLMEVAANYGITFPGVFVESVKKADATIKLLLANPAKLNKFNTKYGAVLSAANYSTGIPVGTLKKLIQLINSNYYTFTPQAFVNSL